MAPSAPIRNTIIVSNILFTLALIVAVANAHSFLSHPCPISTLDGCRIGGTGGFIGNCPGPCPNYNMAADADPTNPAAVWKRGSYNRVVWTRNNHEGGFIRWTIVPLERMWDKASHERMAIDFGCWNVGRFHCNEFDFHRDCNYDRQNEAFSKMLYIPPIYPDGDYVLGMTWYGGGEGYGHFGDYYDCSYIRIEGGDRLEDRHVATFSAGGGSKYEDGCESTTDGMGVCWKEPCIPIRKTSKMVPKEFKDGKQPPAVLSKWFAPQEPRRATWEKGVKIERLHLVDAKRDLVLQNDLSGIIELHRNDEISLLADVTGSKDIDYVQWYTNGRQKGRDYAPPYTIAGDFRGDFYPWMHPLFNRRIRVSAKAVAKDGTVCWTSVELRFSENKHVGVAQYKTHKWDEFHIDNGAQHKAGSSSFAAAKPWKNPHSGNGATATASGGSSSVALSKRSGMSFSKRSAHSNININNNDLHTSTVDIPIPLKDDSQDPMVDDDVTRDFTGDFE